MAKTKRESFDDAADVAKMLSDATRLKILSLIASGGPQSVGVICDAVKLRQPTVSHHLGLLRMSRLVEGKRHGKQVIYSVGGGLGKNEGLKALTTLLVKLGG